MSDRFSLKLGRFYKDDKILQHEEVLNLLNESHTEIMNLRADLTKFNRQYDFNLDLIKFIWAKGFADEDFKEFTEEMSKINEEKPIVFNDSESIDDLLSKYVKNKRFYCRYNKGHYYILDRKQDLPSIYVNNIADAIYVANYLNKQDNTKEDG